MKVEMTACCEQFYGFESMPSNVDQMFAGEPLTVGQMCGNPETHQSLVLFELKPRFRTWGLQASSRLILGPAVQAALGDARSEAGRVEFSADI